MWLLSGSARMCTIQAVLEAGFCSPADGQHIRHRSIQRPQPLNCILFLVSDMPTTPLIFRGWCWKMMIMNIHEWWSEMIMYLYYYLVILGVCPPANSNGYWTSIVCRSFSPREPSSWGRVFHCTLRKSLVDPSLHRNVARQCLCVFGLWHVVGRTCWMVSATDGSEKNLGDILWDMLWYFVFELSGSWLKQCQSYLSISHMGLKKYQVRWCWMSFIQPWCKKSALWDSCKRNNRRISKSTDYTLKDDATDVFAELLTPIIVFSRP